MFVCLYGTICITVGWDIFVFLWREDPLTEQPALLNLRAMQQGDQLL